MLNKIPVKFLKLVRPVDEQNTFCLICFTVHSTSCSIKKERILNLPYKFTNCTDIDHFKRLREIKVTETKSTLMLVICKRAMENFENSGIF